MTNKLTPVQEKASEGEKITPSKVKKDGLSRYEQNNIIHNLSTGTGCISLVTRPSTSTSTGAVENGVHDGKLKQQSTG